MKKVVDSNRHLNQASLVVVNTGFAHNIYFLFEKLIILCGDMKNDG